jgi:hypothetical protein
MTFCSALASSRRDGFAIAALIRYKMRLVKGVFAGLFVSSGGLPEMKRVSKPEGSQNQKDNVNVTLFCLYDCIAFDVDWPRHDTGNG